TLPCNDGSIDLGTQTADVDLANPPRTVTQDGQQISVKQYTIEATAGLFHPALSTACSFDFVNVLMNAAAPSAGDCSWHEQNPPPPMIDPPKLGWTGVCGNDGCKDEKPFYGCSPLPFLDLPTAPIKAGEQLLFNTYYVMRGDCLPSSQHFVVLCGF